jgi:hypothetical protein
VRRATAEMTGLQLETEMEGMDDSNRMEQQWIISHQFGLSDLTFLFAFHSNLSKIVPQSSEKSGDRESRKDWL